MPTMPLQLEVATRELRKASQTVGITDRIYPISGDEVRIDDVLVRGDLTGTLEYNSKSSQ